MPQFMTAEVVLVLHHIFSRQISFDTGIMTCRNKHGSRDFTRQINSLKSSDFEESEDRPDPRSNCHVNSVIESITTSCKSLGHTAEAAGAARRRQFSMMDYFGLNSLFLTITPDDECNFRVRLYADPGESVSTLNDKTPHWKKLSNIQGFLECSHSPTRLPVIFSMLYQMYQTRRRAKKIYNTGDVYGCNILVHVLWCIKMLYPSSLTGCSSGSQITRGWRAGHIRWCGCFCTSTRRTSTLHLTQSLANMGETIVQQ